MYIGGAKLLVGLASPTARPLLAIFCVSDSVCPDRPAARDFFRLFWVGTPRPTDPLLPPKGGSGALFEPFEPFFLTSTDRPTARSAARFFGVGDSVRPTHLGQTGRKRLKRLKKSSRPALWGQKRVGRKESSDSKRPVFPPPRFARRVGRSGQTELETRKIVREGRSVRDAESTFNFASPEDNGYSGYDCAKTHSDSSEQFSTIIFYLF